MHETGIAFSATAPARRHALELVESGEQTLNLPSICALQDAHAHPRAVLFLESGAPGLPIAYL